MEDFTNDELLAIEEYVGPSFELINALLTIDDSLSTELEEVITDKEQLSALIKLCIDLYTAILKYSYSSSRLPDEVYRGISKRGLERMNRSNYIRRFLSTSMDFDNTLDSYGNPLYDRIFLRFNIQNIPCLVVEDLYKFLLEQGKIDQRTYYSSLGESEVLLLPFNKIINITQNELYTGRSKNGTRVIEMPIYDVTLCPVELEQLVEEEEKYLCERIFREVDDMKCTNSSYIGSEESHNNIEFRKLVTKYLKARFARIDEEFNYLRKNGILIRKTF